MTLSRISRMKFGIVDEVYMNTVADAVDIFLNMKPAIEQSIALTARLQSRPFFAVITKATSSLSVDLVRFDGSLSNNLPVMWVYEWSSVILGDADENGVSIISPVSVVTSEDVTNSIPDSEGQGGDVEIVSGLAINLAEMANEGTFEESGIVFGVNIESSMYPNGFIPVGTQVGDYVSLQKSISNDGAIIYFFDRQGTHDGNCE